VVLVVDGAVGPRLGAYAGHGAAVALATVVRLMAVGFVSWLAFRRREVEEDEFLARVASYLAGAGSVPSDVPSPLDEIAAAAGGIRERIALERERASRARSRISEVALKVQRESDRYQNGAAQQV